LIFVFEDCLLDTERRELRRGSQLVAVEPQVFDVLEFLIRNRARVISIDDLITAIWKGRIVSESALSSRMTAVRHAIGDSGKQQSLIRTVPRKGYRFVGSVHEERSADNAGEVSRVTHPNGLTGTPSPHLEQSVTFSRTRGGINLAVACLGSGPVLVRAAHWGTHVEYDLQNPLTGPLLQRLAGRFRLVRYDGRGTGLSDWNAPEISFATLLEDLETVVDKLALERFALLGMHGAAAVSIAYAVRHPRRVSRFVLYGGYAQGHYQRGSTGDADWANAMITVLGSSQERPVFVRAFSSLWLPSGTPEQIKWFMDAARVSLSGENQARFGIAVGNIDVLDLLPMVRVPTIVFHCIRDNLIPFDQGRQLACAIPHARFVALDSENHALLSTEPAWKK
jgi:DNA-binding winged helix-turn-helix (wHTH) protein/pimeloyl-ACP methyl ester carboxylesterase